MVPPQTSPGDGRDCCAIIPAYNEAARVGSVVRLVVESGLFAEVLVVDDGSNDGTADAAREAGATVISHAKNQGKPAAMLTGIRETRSPNICFIDADLLAVSRDHLWLLLEPVVTGREQASLAVFSGGRLATTLAQKISPMISGQRCINRGLMDDFRGWDSGFGIETAINDYLKRRGIRQHIVEWQGAAQVMKEEKRGFIRGFLARLKMYWDILVTWIKSRFSTDGKYG